MHHKVIHSNRELLAQGVSSNLSAFPSGENFVGRLAEVKQLKNAFHSALQKQGNVYIISGESGIGKTALAGQLKPIAKANLKPFMEGGFELGDRQQPYLAFKQILITYIKRFRSYPHDKKAAISAELKKQMENYGIDYEKEIQSFAPQLGELLDLNLNDENLSFSVKMDTSSSEQLKFCNIFIRFLLCLAAAEQGMVIVLNDLQWLDSYSKEVLEKLSREQLASSYLLLVCTYKEIQPLLHVNFDFLKENLLASAKELALQNFNLRDTEKMIVNELQQRNSSISALANWVQKKSGGNPFYALEIVKQLKSANTEKNAIDPPVLYLKNNQWTFSEERAERISIAPLTKDSIHDKLNVLDNETKALLIYAAAVGAQSLTVEDLSRLCPKLNATKIRNAVEAQLVRLNDQNEIVFVHDYIRQVLLNDLPEKIRSVVHAAALNFLDGRLTTEEKTEQAEDLYYHAQNSQSAVILDQSWKHGYTAALKHAQGFAYAEAINVLESVVASTQEGSEGHIQSGLKLAELYLVVGQVASAENLLNKIMPFLNSPPDKARAYSFLCAAYYKQANYSSCEYYGLNGLKILEESFPERVTKGYLALQLLDVMASFPSEQSRADKERAAQKIWFYNTLAWNYSTTDRLKLTYCILKMNGIARHFLPKSSEEALSYCGLGLIMLNLGKFNSAQKYFEKAEILYGKNEKNKNAFGLGQLYQFSAYNYLWLKADFRRAQHYLEKSLKYFSIAGDNEHIARVQTSMSYVYYALAKYPAADELNKKYFVRVTRANDTYGLASANLMQLSLRAETGSLEQAEKSGLTALGYARELYKRDEQQMLCNVLTELSMLYLEKGELEKAKGYITEAIEHYNAEGANFNKEYSINILNDHAEILIAYYRKYKNDTAKIPDSENFLRQIQAASQRALRETKNWPTHYGGALRAAARYNVLVNKKDKAKKLFLQSIKHCKLIGRKYELGKSMYHYASLFNSTGRDENYFDRIKILDKALQIFCEIRSEHYIKRLEKKLSQ
ncbi:putative serine/threonine protein kinase [Candidatus Termititenax aidoneus]|uniref:Serine/threonine protein kinase n=1 Tax=Termititenax aidoneus TaxID=2218524 RepID=A0A388T9H6_TERA1|nr:putative serine/threonine protein kinase [Candidatus Termititenax aidoneus]